VKDRVLITSDEVKASVSYRTALSNYNVSPSYDDI
jgi:hypothetical protein